MITDKIKSYVLMGITVVLLVSLTVLGYRYNQRGNEVLRLTQKANELEVLLTNERLSYATATAELEQKNRNTEHQLSQAVERLNQERNEQIAALTQSRDSLLKRVRNAEANTARLKQCPTATVTTDGEVVTVDSGTELLGTLGEEDVHEATRADTIRLALLGCYQQYDEARASLAKYRESPH